MSVDASGHLNVGRPVGRSSGKCGGVVEGDRYVRAECASPTAKGGRRIGGVRRQVRRSPVGQRCHVGDQAA